MALFKPTALQHRVTDISPSWLRDAGISAILLDADNTLSRHGEKTPYTGVLDWIQTVAAAGMQLIIVSNNKEARVQPFATQFGLPHISMALKPLPFGYLRARRLLQVRTRDCLVVGDQIFTDILGANLCGMRSVLLDPIAPDPLASVRAKRWLENKWFRPRYQRQMTPINKTTGKDDRK